MTSNAVTKPTLLTFYDAATKNLESALTQISSKRSDMLFTYNDHLLWVIFSPLVSFSTYYCIADISQKQRCVHTWCHDAVLSSPRPPEGVLCVSTPYNAHKGISCLPCTLFRRCVFSHCMLFQIKGGRARDRTTVRILAFCRCFCSAPPPPQPKLKAQTTFCLYKCVCEWCLTLSFT